MRSIIRGLIAFVAASVITAAAGCGGKSPNGDPVSQAPAADPSSPVAKDAKSKPPGLPK
jgi:hypothetical protein